MKKSLCSLFFFGVSTLAVHSAQVEWNVISISYDWLGNEQGVYPLYCSFESSHVSPPLDIFLPMKASQLEIGVEIRMQSYSLYMEYANAFVGAEHGDVVDNDYIEANPRCFSYARYSDYNGEDLHSNYSVILKDSETEFLAFRNETSDGDTTFGWMELGLGDDGKVQVLRSAWDRDGDPIVVGMGPIPEPMSGFLLLVGGALLALRRKGSG